ncbi:MAG TPA: beta-galactosidase [Bacteroidota bacterium]|nr:beta-galactosidase [Bacteroidota bacterium]
MLMIALSRPCIRGVFSLLVLCVGYLSYSQELYVGANYHPHDSDPKTWSRDIQLMQQAGFRVVRMGHLAWDSYEPKDGHFDFGWFDQVMDKMHAAGIKVILDVAVRPAPLWLHHKHPSINVADVNGILQYPNHRYMEDVGDPYYQQYALRFANALVRHYAKHPALLAFGIDNEPGDGPISYSATVRARYISWLKAKYGSVEKLNRAWAGQRWSRRVGTFDEVGLPVSAGAVGSPERVLDFRRFVSDEVSGFEETLIDQVRADAPGVLTTGNMWYYSTMKYFDYSKIAYSGKIARGGCGFYPGLSIRNNEGIEGALFGMERIQFENTTPFWCTEFTTMTAVPGSIRKSAYASLMLGNQLICGWTWQSMHAGEEQFLEGMTDWDGRPNRKYFEYKNIAAEFRKIEGYGFPYKPVPDVALAFSFPSQIASGAFPEPHDGQVQTSFTCFNKRNVDTRVVDLIRSRLPYKLLVIPGVAVMDDVSASKIREFINGGGTAIMTGYSAMLDEHHQVFSTTLPGRLSDVFGIRVSSFEETESMNELSRLGLQGRQLRVRYRDRNIACESPRFDVIEPTDAEVLGSIVGLDREYPVVTTHKFGAGIAVYIGLPAREELLDPIIGESISRLAIKTGPEVPAGVMARQINPTHLLYLNLDGTAKHVELKGRSYSILRNQEYEDGFTIGPYEPEFVEIR